MSEIGDKIQEKCMSFGDRVIKLNDYLLEQASHITSDIQRNNNNQYKIRIPVYLRSVANLSNQLLRSGTSIGANNAEAISAISKADYRSKSYIALKETRESLYWIEMMHRNNYINDIQYQSLNKDCEELVKIFSYRCKKLDQNIKKD